MATKRSGGTGIFKSASRTPRKRQTGTGSSPLLSPPASVTYSWDMASDTLSWGPNASEVLGLDAGDLPQSGEAFAHLFEPGIGRSRLEAMDPKAPEGSFETRYALRFAPNRVLIVQDSGRWQPGSKGRPILVRGLLRAESTASQADLPAIVRERSELLCRIQGGVNDALLVSQTCTLIVGSFEDEDIGSVLTAIRALRPMMRRNDHIAFLGPRRFVLTLTSCPASEATSAMKRLGHLLADHPARASLHLGAASSPDHTFQATKLLRFAESALASAIAQNDSAVFYDPAKAISWPLAEGTPDDILAELNERRLMLACRPVVDALTRKAALVQARACLPGRGKRPVPLASIPSVEGGNLALLVDGRMLELAADYLLRQPEERLMLPIALETLHDPEWLEMLAAHLGARPGIASRLMIEIPEAALADAPAARGRLDAMKALGVGIALAGFGTGHALLAHLEILPIDLLKIDGVFIQALKRSTDDRLYVRTLVDRAYHLGIATMAEWVDDDPTARMLAAWGVDYLQGAAFGGLVPVTRPSTLDSILKRA